MCCAEEAEEEARIAATARKVEATEVKQPAPVPPKASKVLPTVRYQYYQSASTLNMSVMAKNLTSEDVTVEFTPGHLLVKVKLEGQEGKLIGCG